MNSDADTTTLTNAITGNRIRFERIPSETDEGTLEFELTISPGFEGRLFELELRDSRQTLSLTVIEGILREEPRSETDGSTGIRPEPTRIGEGQRVTIDGRTRRRFWNGLPDAETRVVVRVSPSFDSYQFITTGYEIARRRAERSTADPDDGDEHASDDRISAGESSRNDGYGSTGSDEGATEALPPGDHRDAPSVFRANRYVWRRIGWKSTLVGGLLCLLSYWVFVTLVVLLYADRSIGGVEAFLIWAITIVSLSPVLGYLMRVSRGVLYGYPEFPGFGNWSALLVDGLKAGLVFLLYLTIPLYAIAAILGPASILIYPLAHQYEGAMELLTLLASFIAYYVFPAAYMRFVETEKLGSVLDRRTLQSVVWRRSYFVAHLRFVAVYIALLVYVAIAVLLYTVVASQYLDLFLTSVTLFYALVLSSVYFAEVWKSIQAERPASGDPSSTSGGPIAKAVRWFRTRTLDASTER